MSDQEDKPRTTIVFYGKKTYRLNMAIARVKVIQKSQPYYWDTNEVEGVSSQQIESDKIYREQR